MAKSKTVQRSVSVVNPETQQAEWFHKGDELPDWAADVVTNDRVFEDPDGETSRRSNDVVTDSQATDYGSMIIDELDILLEERGLDKTGNKKDKIDRLKASDAATG